MTEKNEGTTQEHDSAAADAQGPSSPAQSAGMAGPHAGLLSPEIRPGRALRWSWVWLVPLLALAVALTLLASVWVRTGPTITVSFQSASGLEVGQTKLRYRDVIVGEVKDIRFAQDRQNVLVDVQLRREGSEYITQKDSKFWLVQPQVSLAGVSGLETLLSGVYMSVDASTELQAGRPVYEFEGLNNPPEILSGQKGTHYELRTDNLGSIVVGSRVYYRRIEVGRVISHDMTSDGRLVRIQIFVDEPYDKFVTNDTRFWDSSGIDMSLSTDGLQVRTGGLAAMLHGGIAFAQADESSAFEGVADTTPAAADSIFQLFETRELALADPDGDPVPIELRFDQSVRGLHLGAPIDFRGMAVGKVIDIDLEYDAQRRRFYIRVRGEIFPSRFGEDYTELIDTQAKLPMEELLAPLVQYGLRAQLRSASLLTGQQYVSMDFFPPDKIKDRVIGGPDTTGFLVPTLRSDFDRLQEQVSNIVSSLEGVPFDEIGEELRDSLKSLGSLLRRLDGDVSPQATKALDAARLALDQLNRSLAPESPLMLDMQGTLQSLGRAARALRLLADNLIAHPESLLRGHAPDTLR